MKSHASGTYDIFERSLLEHSQGLIVLNYRDK